MDTDKVYRTSRSRSGEIGQRKSPRSVATEPGLKERKQGYVRGYLEKPAIAGKKIDGSKVETGKNDFAEKMHDSLLN